MSPLEALVRDASRAADGLSPEGEVARQLEICNACRYCEGFCAVFPAMTRRLVFDAADVHYLANLCHNCGACLHACQYAPPHDFAVNVPRAMARVRLRTYRAYAWPRALGALYEHNGLVLALALAAALALFVALAARGGPVAAATGSGFYDLIPHQRMVALFAPIFLFAALALAIGGLRFWREAPPGPALPGAGREAVANILGLRYLDGGHGDGCNEADDRFTPARRRLHHLTFYGLALCFASTTVATLYHFVLHRPAPYAPSSLPVMLGVAGGIGLLIGPAGLLWLNLRRSPLHGDPSQRPMDRGFIALLLLVAGSGMALLVGRETSAMASLLVVHLGAVMALFLTLPYGKFAHGVYRGLALLKSAIERRRPHPLRLGSE